MSTESHGRIVPRLDLNIEKKQRPQSASSSYGKLRRVVSPSWSSGNKQGEFSSEVNGTSVASPKHQHLEDAICAPSFPTRLQLKRPSSASVAKSKSVPNTSRLKSARTHSASARSVYPSNATSRSTSRAESRDTISSRLKNSSSQSLGHYYAKNALTVKNAAPIVSMPVSFTSHTVHKQPKPEKKSRSHVIELEIKLAEKLKSLEPVRLTEENSETLRASYLKIYQQIFEEIIQASPYAELLTRIKETYEKDPVTLNRVSAKKSYDEILVEYARCQEEIADLRKELENAKRKEFRLTNEAGILKKQLSTTSVEFAKMKKQVSEESKSNKSKLLYLIEQNSKNNLNSARSTSSMASVEQSPVPATETPIERVIPSEFDEDSPVPMNPEDDENKQKRFNDLFSGLDVEGDPEVKELHDRDRKYELEAELTRIRLREREIVRELNMLKIQTGEVDPSQNKLGARAMMTFEHLDSKPRTIDALSNVKEEQDPIHIQGKKKLRISHTDLSPSVLAAIKRIESVPNKEFVPYIQHAESVVYENEDEIVKPKTPVEPVQITSVRERLLVKAARHRARQNGEQVDEAFNFLDDEDDHRIGGVASKQNFGVYNARNLHKMDHRSLSPRGGNVKFAFGKDDSDAPVNLEFKTDSSDTYLAVDDVEEVEFLNKRRR